MRGLVPMTADITKNVSGDNRHAVQNCHLRLKRQQQPSAPETHPGKAVCVYVGNGRHASFHARVAAGEESGVKPLMGRAKKGWVQRKPHSRLMLLVAQAHHVFTSLPRTNDCASCMSTSTCTCGHRAWHER